MIDRLGLTAVTVTESEGRCLYRLQVVVRLVLVTASTCEPFRTVTGPWPGQPGSKRSQSESIENVQLELGIIPNDTIDSD